MEQITSTNKSFLNSGIYILAAVLILCAAVGGFYFGKKSSVTEQKTQDQIVREIFSGMPFTNNLFGIIKEINISGKYITLEAKGLAGLNLPQEYRNKKIIVNQDTKIRFLENKDPEVFKKEMEKQAKSKTDNSKENLNPASPFIEKEISLNDLKVGDQISVITDNKQGASILDNEFTAVQIIFNKGVSIPNF
ncbi:MAG: hypothetical protein QMD86_02920 [Patescibacteria group bacterium]|nr:hypothetical protein [Patescibacteria group bacterium]